MARDAPNQSAARERAAVCGPLTGPCSAFRFACSFVTLLLILSLRIACGAASSSMDAPTLPAVPYGPGVPAAPGSGTVSPSRSGAPAATQPNGFLREGAGRYEDMALIPEGAFDMGSPEGRGRPDERPLHQVTLKAFWIAKREISVGEYCEFLNQEGAVTKDGLPRMNLESPDCPVIKVGKKRFRPKPGYEKRPITQVSWHGAADYANWAGGRLPTSAEWEKAALLAGGAQAHDVKALSTQEGPEHTDKMEPEGGSLAGMAGNVWEWCADWYAKDYYASSPQSDPVGPSLGEEKVIRGGSWASTEASRRTKNRHCAPPLGCYRTVGFRIVKD